MSTDMERILIKLGYDSAISMFEKEKITPDVVCRLSIHEMRYLGIGNCSDMMKLRVECISYGGKYTAMNDARGIKYDISKECLKNLLGAGFKVKEISNLLSVSERTIYRRMNEFNMSVHEFTDIADVDLKIELKKVTEEFPRIGETMIKQILEQRGIKITRSRLRDILHETDQMGITERLRRALHRRVYNVLAPNHLWHLDTNHKLIRWCFIICGGIDGFSRMVVYLKCTNNNKAETILQCFLEATQKYGTPLRVRTDQGMENIRVAEHMILARGEDRRSAIAGKSTHNQRIERLWRDVYDGVLCFYYDLFYFMEDQGILNPLDEVHITALHRVFLDKINEKLLIWSAAWAKHRIRTARTSPLRLFLAGTMNCPVEIPLTETNAAFYGVEGNIPLHALENDTRPTLDPLDFYISSECEQELNRICPSNWNSDNFGIDIYLQAVEVIQRHTSTT